MKIPGSYCFRGFSFYIPGKLQFLTGEQFLDREEKEVRLRNKKGNFMLMKFPFLSRILKLILVVNSFFFDSSFLTGKSTQVIQFSATNFTYLVHLDAVDSR